MGGGVSGRSRQTVMLHAAAFLCPPASSASQEETVMDPRSLFIAGDRPTLALLSPLGGRPPRPVALRAHMWLCSWRGAGKRAGKGSGRGSAESNPRGSGERIRSEEAERHAAGLRTIRHQTEEEEVCWNSAQPLLFCFFFFLAFDLTWSQDPSPCYGSFLFLAAEKLLPSCQVVRRKSWRRWVDFMLRMCLLKRLAVLGFCAGWSRNPLWLISMWFCVCTGRIIWGRLILVWSVRFNW